MRFSLIVGLAALAFAAGCSSPELDPAPQPLLDGPELTMPREPKKTADPPPPIHEHRLDTSPQSGQQYIYLTETTAASTTATPAATTGTVNALTPK